MNDDPRAAMISELATTENFLVIKELHELWDEILVEHFRTLFDQAFTMVGNWSGYCLFGIPEDGVIEISLESIPVRRSSLFRFSVCVDDSDQNWWFGIRGPWDLASRYPAIAALKKECDEKQLRTWQNFRYRFFTPQRTDVYCLLREKADVNSLLVEMVQQFRTTWETFRLQIEEINLEIKAREN